MHAAALAFLIATAACGDPMILLFGRPPSDASASLDIGVGIDTQGESPPRNRLIAFAGYSQTIGVSRADSATDTTLQDPFGAVQLVEKYYGESGPGWTDHAQRDMAPRPFSLGGSYVIGTAGAELSMARALVAGSSDTWAMAKMGADGTQMAGFWNETVTAPYPRVVFADFIDAAKTTFGIVSNEDVFVVMFEGLLDDGSTYQATLNSFFGYLDTRLPGHRRVLDQLHIVPAVEAAIAAFAAADGGRTLIVPSADLPTLSDSNPHYPMDSYDAWGRRASTAIRSFRP